MLGLWLRDAPTPVKVALSTYSIAALATGLLVFWVMG